MSLLFAGGVGLAYAAGVIGVHRLTVAQRRAAAQGYPTVRWLDWDTLLGGLLPSTPAAAREGPVPREGGPVPRVLLREGPRRELTLLTALVEGSSLQAEAFAEAGFSGGEARWLGTLSWLRDEPWRVLAELERVPAQTVAEAYLREWLVHELEVSPVNLELATFASKRRINVALRRFGEHPALYFVRARASAQLGFTQAVLDDLARAVYFSREAPFYLQAVTRLPAVEELRPALHRACAEALARAE